MCLAIAYKGKDILYGYNLDVDPSVWQFSICKSKSVFALGVTVGKTKYYVHGINKNGNFGNVPYMNGEVFPEQKGLQRERIDLMNDRYIRGKYSFEDIEEIISDTYVTLWNNTEKLDINKKISSYLFGITKNLIKKKYRKIKSNSLVFDNSFSLFDMD